MEEKGTKLDNFKGKRHILTDIDSTKGGQASATARKRKKSMKELAELMLKTKVQDEGMKEFLKVYGVKTSDMNYKAMIIAQQINLAIQGELKSAEFVRDTIGEKPVEKQEVVVEETDVDEITSTLNALLDRNVYGIDN